MANEAPLRTRNVAMTDKLEANANDIVHKPQQNEPHISNRLLGKPLSTKFPHTGPVHAALTP